MAPYWIDECAASAGVHTNAKQVREVIERAREQVASLLGCPDRSEEIVFVNSGTEAINLAVLGYVRANRRFGNHVVCSPIEHPAVLNSLTALEQEGVCQSFVSVDNEGFLQRDSLAELLTDHTLLVCCQLANLDIGAIQALEPVGAMIRERGIAFFVDATAAAGRMEVNVDRLKADLLALSPHRFGGPKGVGCLYRNRRLKLAPLVHGGEQETGLWPGTENVPAIVGCGVAAESAERHLDETVRRLRGLQSRLWLGLQEAVPGGRLNGPPLGRNRVCHQLSLRWEGIEAEGLALFADMQGLGIATGSGCLSRSLESHHVLSAIGLNPAQTQQTVTLGIGLDTAESDIDRAVEILRAGVERLRSITPPADSAGTGGYGEA